MEWKEDEIQLVPLAWLKTHEAIKPRNKDKLFEMTQRWKGYTKPLLVDKRTGVILDGHHRYHVGVELGLQRVPAVCVDYLTDDRITVTAWPASGRETLTKGEVIAMGWSDEVFPPKTSRHAITDDMPPIHVPLDRLMHLQDD